MSKSENLSSVAIGVIYKDDRSHWIGDGKSAKLLNLERPIGRLTDNSASHYKKTERFDSTNKCSQEVGPLRLWANFGIKIEIHSDVSGYI